MRFDLVTQAHASVALPPVPAGDPPLPGELATDQLEPGVAQDASFVEHRHDQSLLSLLAKKRGLKSYPLPTTTHDVRDVWAWEAGYCKPGFEWPLPPPTLTLTFHPNPRP